MQVNWNFHMNTISSQLFSVQFFWWLHVPTDKTKRRTRVNLREDCTIVQNEQVHRHHRKEDQKRGTEGSHQRQMVNGASTPLEWSVDYTRVISPDITNLQQLFVNIHLFFHSGTNNVGQNTDKESPVFLDGRTITTKHIPNGGKRKGFNR